MSETSPKTSPLALCLVATVVVYTVAIAIFIYVFLGGVGMSAVNVILFGYGGQMYCCCNGDEAVVNHLLNFDADFGLSRCIVKNAGESVVRFAREHFGGNTCYQVVETGDGLLVEYVA